MTEPTDPTVLKDRFDMAKTPVDALTIALQSLGNPSDAGTIVETLRTGGWVVVAQSFVDNQENVTRQAAIHAEGRRAGNRISCLQIAAGVVNTQGGDVLALGKSLYEWAMSPFEELCTDADAEAVAAAGG